MVKRYFKTLGPQRVGLTILVLLVVLASPIAYLNEASFEGWLSIPTIVAPAMVPILFFLLLLDMLMSKVFLSNADAAGKQRFRFILLAHTISLIVLMAAWLPFMLSLLEL